jgi:hypothetical protein
MNLCLVHRWRQQSWESRLQGLWVSRQTRRPATRNERMAFRPRFETLEDRTLPSTFTVINTNDDINTGSLRWAITRSDGTPGSNIIKFQIGTGAQSIAILSPLPSITVPVVIDGTSQPGFAGKPLIELNGSGAGAARGLDIAAANCSVRDLVINRFLKSGIYIHGIAASANLIAGNFIGTDASGSVAKPNGGDGIQLDQGTRFNTIGGTTAAARNVVSGNTMNGIEIDNNAAGNLVAGNFIGTSAAGTGALGNRLNGVAYFSAADNTLGGSTTASANVIANNGSDGVYTKGNGVPAGTVSWYKAENNANDSVGTNNGTLKGGASFAPGKSGQAFALNGTDAYVDVPSSPSLKPTSALTVSAWINLAIDPSTVTSTTVVAKGVDAEAPVDWALNVTGTFVQIKGPSHLRAHVNVGGNWTYFDGNTVLQPHQWYFAVMTYDGSNLRIYLNGQLDGSMAATGALQTSDGSMRIGSYAPVNGTNSKSFFNGLLDEVSVYNRALSPTEIQSAYAARGTSLGGNIMQGNLVGINAGSGPLGNHSQGVEIDSSSGNLIGQSSNSPNIISSNGGNGVWIHGAGAINAVAGNYIGTNTVGSAALGNTGNGVQIDTNSNVIGGTIATTRNVISGNLGDGVSITAHAAGNLVEGNYIGTDTSGTGALGNAGNGVHMLSAPDNQIGGASGTTKNVISGNGKDGVYVQGDGQGLVSWYKAQNNTNDSVSNNNGALKGAASFGPGKSGQGFALNGTNAYVDVPSTPSLKLTSALTVSAWLNLAIDPSTVTASAITVKGVDVEGPVDWALTVTGTSVQIKGPGHLRPHVNVNGTWTYFDGNTALQPHQWYFAVMTYDGSNLRIYVNGQLDGSMSATGALQTSDGSMRIGSYAPFNGVDSKEFFNGQLDEVSVYNRALSATEIQSIYAAGGARQNGNVILGNDIGTNATGTTALANTSQGVEIDGSPGNFVGLSATVGANVISGNGANGIEIHNSRANGNVVAGNDIGANASVTAPVPNLGDGVLINSAANNLIGGTAAGTANTIENNGGEGVEVAGGSGNGIRQNVIYVNSGGGIKLGVGGNHAQAFPTLTSVTNSSANTTAQGTLSSAPNTTYIVELFANVSEDPSGFGEGQKFLGSVKVTTDGSGHGSFTKVLAPAVPAGEFISATATDPINNTSAFSRSTKAVGPLTLTAAGTAAGFKLTPFAFNFPIAADTGGPLGMAFTTSGGVMVSDAPGNVRVFATDTDGQNAASVAPGASYGDENAKGLARVGSDFYLAEFNSGKVVKLNADGSFNQDIVSIGLPTGIVANPVNGHLLVTSQTLNAIVDVDPIAKTTRTLISGLSRPDGISITPDGKTVYVSNYGAGHVLGFDLSTGKQVFDSGFISGGADGNALGSGGLAGNLFVNTNDGRVIEINLSSLAQTVLASGGTRGDFIASDPNGSLLVTQSSEIYRLTLPGGGGLTLAGNPGAVSGGPQAPPPAAPTALGAPAAPSTGVLIGRRRGSMLVSPPPTNGSQGSSALTSSQPGPVHGLSHQSIDNFFGGSANTHNLFPSSLPRLRAWVVNDDAFDWQT